MERTDVDLTTVIELLRGAGLRITPQRRAIVSEILRTNGHIAPVAIARAVERTVPGVNASTIYRTMSVLEEVGVLRHSHAESGAEYHRAEEAGHAHLVCRNCGSDDALSTKDADAITRIIRRRDGFRADLTHFAITGLCDGCARKAERTTRR
jgi:Fur family ferric uptake transcriptional regulator